jgi:hypothetical protein
VLLCGSGSATLLYSYITFELHSHIHTVLTATSPYCHLFCCQLATLDSYLTVKSVPCESLPTDTVVGAVGVLALGERVAVEDVEDTFVVVRAAILRTALHGKAVVAEAAEGAQHVFTLAVLANLPK